MQRSYIEFESPIGTLLLAGNRDVLTHLGFQEGPRPTDIEDDWVEDGKPFEHVRGQLDQYFAGALQTFDVNLAPQGTEFQQQVWNALRSIPYGATTSYGEIAERIGNSKAARAVGAANGQNPIPIIVPCHRVIGSSGSLTGFGGGLPIKQHLLALENRVAGSQLELA